MTFDKVKAMKNAEKYLSQGKIRAVINEYERIVENDPKDYGSLNMLGDLYIKASEKEKAVRCFVQVANYYSSLGFAQKAIAVYNKISRLMPDSLEVSAKLAQLYQMKGSVAEARTHYTALAEEYSRTGRKAEALEVWKEIGNLDPTNADIFLKIADACRTDRLAEEAADAYVEAGKRFSAKKQFDTAIEAYTGALEIRKDDLSALRGLVEAQANLGYSEDAAKILEQLITDQPYNREILHLLIDCYLNANKPAEAEKKAVELIEREPANYPKLLEIVDAYLRANNAAAAAACLARISENLLLSGQFGELESQIEKILVKDPEDITALRLLLRFRDWQKNDENISNALERMAHAAHLNNYPAEEYSALSRLSKYRKDDTTISKRLEQLAEYATEDTEFAASLMPLSGEIIADTELSETAYSESVEQIADEAVTYELETNGFAADEKNAEADFEETLVSSENGAQNPVQVGYGDFVIENFGAGEENLNGHKQTEVAETHTSAPQIVSEMRENADSEFGEAQTYALHQELDSIEFYIEQGYGDLAEKALDDIELRYGKHSDIDKYREKIKTAFGSSTNISSENLSAPEIEPTASFSDTAEDTADEAIHISTFDDFRSDLGLEETEKIAESDFETLYQTGIVYKEMGLLEDAIKEFQAAAEIAKPDDGTRNFFLACNLLGHSFIEKQMPALALIWYKRALEQKNLEKEEIIGLQYEIADAYEQSADKAKAIEYFEKIYADNVGYRDTDARLNHLKNV